MASVLAAGPAVLPASAHEGGSSRPLVTCVGSATVRFAPGLALRPRHTRIGGTAAYTCTGGDPAVKWGKSVIEGAGEAGCLSVSSEAVERITWNTGEHSTVFYGRRNVVQPAAGEVLSLVEGTVVEGKYKGSRVASPGAQLALNVPDCATDKGVEVVDGPSTLLFT